MGLKKICCCCCSNDEVDNFTYERAPEPTDVYWENLNVPILERIFRIFLTYFATFILILICFWIIYGLNVAKVNLKKKEEANEGSINKNSLRFLSFLCAFVIIAINKMLNTVVRNLSVKEKQETYTAYNLSVAFKLALARFINTAIVPVIINQATDRWFVDGGLVSDIFSIMISIAFVDPILSFFDTMYYLKLLKRWY